MSLESIRIAKSQKLSPVISVFGVGGGGGNAVNNMHEKDLEGVKFVIANTDAQALAESQVETKIQLGEKTTKGLGAGADPSVGREAAEENRDQIKDALDGVHMVFITAGMGGGTGTGAAPVIAKIARDMEILTIAVVTKPFLYEGEKRMIVAREGIKEIRDAVHTTLIIPNQNLFQISNDQTTAVDAFSKANDVLYEGVKSITDLILFPGLVNLDFADVRTVMMEMGSAMMGTGVDESDQRAINAALSAMNNQLLEDTKIESAKAVLVNVTGGEDLTLFDISQATMTISKELKSSAIVVPGSSKDKNFTGKIKVSLLAAGMDAEDEINDLKQPEGISDQHDFQSVNDYESISEISEEEFNSDFTEPTWRVNIDDNIPDQATQKSQLIDVESSELDEEVTVSTPLEPAPQTHSTFVAPKPVNSAINYIDDIADLPLEDSMNDSDVQISEITDNKSKSWKITDIIQRIKPSVRTDGQQIKNEPSLSSKKVEDDRFNTEFNENDRETPAYMRRQAN